MIFFFSPRGYLVLSVKGSAHLFMWWLFQTISAKITGLNAMGSLKSQLHGPNCLELIRKGKAGSVLSLWLLWTDAVSAWVGWNTLASLYTTPWGLHLTGKNAIPFGRQGLVAVLAAASRSTNAGHERLVVVTQNTNIHHSLFFFLSLFSYVCV